MNSAGRSTSAPRCQVARADDLDPVGLHHRDLVLALVDGDFAADLEALAEQAGDLVVDHVEARGGTAPAALIALLPSEQPGGEGVAAGGQRVQRVAALLDRRRPAAPRRASRRPISAKISGEKPQPPCGSPATVS